MGTGGEVVGKAFSFFAFVWLFVVIAGGVMMGDVPPASTVLTVAIDADDTTISVASTEGFPEPGIIVIGDERIVYSDIDGNDFTQTLAVGDVVNPLIRGAEDTEATSHAVGSGVRTPEGAMMNTTVTYNIAVIADATGIWAALTIGLAILRMIGSFLILPISFLGTDLAIIGVIWWAMVAGMIISLGLALAGARRV